MLLCNHTESATSADLASLGISGALVVNTSDYSNLSGGWSCAVLPEPDQASATAAATSVRGRAPSSYPLKACR
jgi:hypothetical protein